MSDLTLSKRNNFLQVRIKLSWRRRLQIHGSPVNIQVQYDSIIYHRFPVGTHDVVCSLSSVFFLFL